MTFVSLTRLRIRSIRFLPAFAVYTFRSLQQVKRSPGFQDGALLNDRSWTFWTLTAWDSQQDMRNYMISDAHKAAMPKLLHWCDEASVAHWEQPNAALPSWPEADRRMRAEGRVSKVRNPSPMHEGLRYREPRVTTGGRIKREQ